MYRSLSIASFTVVTSFCILGCHGSPPPESTANAGDTTAQPSAASHEAKGSASEAKPAEGQADSTAKSTDDTEKPAAANASSKDCPQGGCRYKCTQGQTCDENCQGGACDMKCEKDSKC